MKETFESIIIVLLIYPFIIGVISLYQDNGQLGPLVKKVLAAIVEELTLIIWIVKKIITWIRLFVIEIKKMYFTYKLRQLKSKLDESQEDEE
jgi:hypothetical protein